MVSDTSLTFGSGVIAGGASGVLRARRGALRFAASVPRAFADFVALGALLPELVRAPTPDARGLADPVVAFDFVAPAFVAPAFAAPGFAAPGFAVLGFAAAVLRPPVTAALALTPGFADPGFAAPVLEAPRAVFALADFAAVALSAVGFVAARPAFGAVRETAALRVVLPEAALAFAPALAVPGFVAAVAVAVFAPDLAAAPLDGVALDAAAFTGFVVPRAALVALAGGRRVPVLTAIACARGRFVVMSSLISRTPYLCLKQVLVIAAGL